MTSSFSPRVMLLSEFRRRVIERQQRVNFPGRSQMAAGIDVGLELALIIMEELLPVCDDPEVPTLADVTEGMKP